MRRWVILLISSAVLATGLLVSAHDGKSNIQEQQTCPPCRQSLAEYDDSVSVVRGDQRVTVCCVGCATKMTLEWDGYVRILNELGERPQTLAEPLIIDTSKRGVCEPCMGGACELPEHKP